MAATGGFAAKPQTAPKYRVVVENGRHVHRYAGGRSVVVPGGIVGKKTTNKRQAIRYTGGALNTQAGNPRQGAAYRIGKDSKGRKVHRYGAGPGGLPAEVVKVKR